MVMGEVDYQIALLLQHQFEQELKRPKQYESDLALARSLQAQFQKEKEIDNPDGNLVYSNKNNVNKANSSKSLTDPSWEVIDPTPDIHMLFIAFNQRFFWNKLLAVCVSWSKRMTKCAGICSYQGRGGLCSITLSEPLLKLRPRKDLVETLLHEMIHAFLFVTHNNRDRDGHGPEFHKHMYRINVEAGTNITVYHDFHDEVRLYQQHWWRCDGPCQKWKPYFGVVRRAMNRAPGPNDRWWGEHSRNCGGNFVKVKEPEKPQKKSTKSVSNIENKKPKENIRNYFPTVSKSINTNNTSVKSKNNIGNDSEVINNIHTVSNKDNSKSKVTAVIPSKVNNIFGFTNLNGSSSHATSSGTSKNFGKGNIKNAIKNNSSTIVITKKTNNSTNNDNNVDSIKPVMTGEGRVLSESLINNNNLDYSAVRSHWANKYPSTSTGIKRDLPQISPVTQRKIPKFSSDKTIPINENIDTPECPVCLKLVPIHELNDHLDKCLQSPEDFLKECIICGMKIHTSEYKYHVNKCSEENFEDDVFEISNDLKNCNFCGNNIVTKDYDNHVQMCSNNTSTDKVIDFTNNLEEKKCGVCEKMVLPELYDSHVENCMLKMYDDLEATYGNKDKKDETVACLACGKTIVKSELNSHLDDCLSLSRVFEDDNEPKEENVENINDEGEIKYNCPICMNLISEQEMNAHVDNCLNNGDNSSEGQSNKSIFLEFMSNSLSDDEF